MTATPSGVYYFLGNITSHVIHALPLYKELGGTFIVTSIAAKETIEKYGVEVICIDNIPYEWQWQGKRPRRVREYLSIGRRLSRTVQYLNQHAQVVVFYEIFEFDEKTQLTPKKIFLTHGNMLKNYFKMHPKRIDVINRQYDYMAALGPFMKREFLQGGIDPAKLVDIGIARSDEVTRHCGEIRLSPTLKHLGIPSNKPIISYLPTFWGDSSVESLGVELLKNISDSYSVIFRPHPQTPKSILDKYMPILARPNMFYIPEDGVNQVGLPEVYTASSVIIGDLSSVMLEAILANKPLIFASTDTNENIEPHQQINDIIAHSHRVSSQNASMINDIIADVISTGIDASLWQQAKQRCYFGYDGTSVQSIIKFIKSL